MYRQIGQVIPILVEVVGVAGVNVELFLDSLESRVRTVKATAGESNSSKNVYNGKSNM